jgi:hypothetical protein
MAAQDVAPFTLSLVAQAAASASPVFATVMVTVTGWSVWGLGGFQVMLRTVKSAWSGLDGLLSSPQDIRKRGNASIQRIASPQDLRIISTPFHADHAGVSRYG